MGIEEYKVIGFVDEVLSTADTLAAAWKANKHVYRVTNAGPPFQVTTTDVMAALVAFKAEHGNRFKALHVYELCKVSQVKLDWLPVWEAS